MTEVSPGVPPDDDVAPDAADPGDPAPDDVTPDSEPAQPDEIDQKDVAE